MINVKQVKFLSKKRMDCLIKIEELERQEVTKSNKAKIALARIWVAYCDFKLKMIKNTLVIND